MKMHLSISQAFTWPSFPPVCPRLCCCRGARAARQGRAEPQPPSCLPAAWLQGETSAHQQSSWWKRPVCKKSCFGLYLGVLFSSMPGIKVCSNAVGMEKPFYAFMECVSSLMVRSLVYSAWWEFFRCAKWVSSGLPGNLNRCYGKLGLFFVKESPPLCSIIKHLMK